MTDAAHRMQQLDLATPVHMVWISTNACNARCQHCSSASAERTPDELTTAEILRVVDEFATAGVLDLGVSGDEPLLRRDLFDVIARVRAHGMTIGVGSNGTSITRANARRLKDAGVDRLQISLDGSKSSHDCLRCWPGLFERVLRAIAVSIDAGLRTHVCCTINRLNASELASFAEAVCQLGVRRINFSRFVPTGRGAHSLDLTNQEWHQVISRCVEIRDRYRGTMEVVTHLAQQVLVDPDVRIMQAFSGCQAGRAQGCLSANGNVMPCVLLPVVIGNVRFASFEEIWRSSAVIRTLQKQDQVKGRCAVCPHAPRCGGCRAVAFARTGDYLASDERCWLNPRAEQPDSDERDEAAASPLPERTATTPLVSLTVNGLPPTPAPECRVIPERTEHEPASPARKARSRGQAVLLTHP